MRDAVHHGSLASRREFIALGAGAFLIALSPRVLRQRTGAVRRTLPVMGTLADITVVHTDTRRAEDAIDAAVRALAHVEDTMTWFRADSEIGRVNRVAATDAVRVSSATADVVREGLRWADATDGRFDPAIGQLVRAWDVTHRREPPPTAVVRRFAGRRLHLAVEVEPWAGMPAIRFHDPDVSLDLGGIAKGFGVDLAVNALRERGIRNAIVNVGGDLHALGRSPEGDPWRVGIRDAHDPAAIEHVIEIEDRAVATSGDYEQGFEYEGRRYHHLLDPRTAAPRAVAVHSLSIAADDCMTADAAATALFGLDIDAARRTLARLEPRATLLHTD